jgi:hypothetical protein
VQSCHFIPKILQLLGWLKTDSRIQMCKLCLTVWFLLLLQDDSDYWLLSDAGISITDMWKTDCILEIIFHLYPLPGPCKSSIINPWPRQQQILNGLILGWPMSKLPGHKLHCMGLLKCLLVFKPYPEVNIDLSNALRRFFSCTNLHPSMLVNYELA